MPDPRGRGFNRGRGKWHAPVRRPLLPTLLDFGWEHHGYIEPYPTAYYTQAEYKLTQRNTGPGRWITTVTNTETGQVWNFNTAFPSEITIAIFGENHLIAPPEISAAGYYGVGR